jgi:hypothetical protein
MRPLMFIAAALAVASCNRPALLPGAAFAQETAGRIAQAPRTCISTFGSENLRPLDRATLAFGSGRTIYINRLAAECPGLEPLNTLIVEAQGSQYCRGDRVRGLEPGGLIPGPTCILGDWVPYTRP